MRKQVASLFLTLCLTIAFFSAYEIQSIKLYDAHQTRGDLTNFAQAMWNTVHGRPMQNTFNYTIHNIWGGWNLPIPDNSNIFGIHFNPIMFLFVPVYALFQTPKTLLTIQALLTACGGLLVFLLAKRKTQSDLLAIALALSYWLYFSLVAAVLYEFHAATLGIFFGLLMITLFEFGKYRWFFVAFCLFLAIQENAPIIALFYAFYILLIRRQRILGAVCAAGAIVYFIVVTQFAIPHLSNYHAFIFESAYGNVLGNNFQQIIIGSIKHPITALHVFFNKANFEYVGHLTEPLLPFVFLAPALYLVALTGLLPNLITSDASLKSSALHYDAFAIPFLFAATILGVAWLLGKMNERSRTYVVWGSAAVILLLTFINYRETTSLKLNPSLLRTSIRRPVDTDLDAAQAKIPAGASLATQDYASAQLAQRRILYEFPVHADRVDYLLLAKNDQTWPLPVTQHQTLMNEFIFNPAYQVVYQNTNFIVIKRKGV